jgi:hypothetical protein
VRLQSLPQWRDDIVELFLLEPAHVGAHYVGWLNDSSMNRFLESRFVVHDETSVRAFVDDCLANPDVLFMGVRHLSSGRHVGNVKLEINRAMGAPKLASSLAIARCRGRGWRRARSRCFAASPGSNSDCESSLPAVMPTTRAVSVPSSRLVFP